MTVATPMYGGVLAPMSRPGTLSRLLGRNVPSNAWSKVIKQIPFDDEAISKEIHEDTNSITEEVVSRV